MLSRIICNLPTHGITGGALIPNSRMQAVSSEFGVEVLGNIPSQSSSGILSK